MNFKVNSSRREEVIHKVIRSRRDLRTIQLCARLTIPIFLVLSVALYVLGLRFPHAGFQSGTSRWSAFIYIGVFLLFGFVIHRIVVLLLGNRLGPDLLERLEETLRIDGNRLDYSFRLRYHSLPADRIILTVPLDRIPSIVYEPETCKLVFRGPLSSVMVGNYDPDKRYSPEFGTLQELVIYDYFDPGLLEYLKQYGMIVSKGEI